MTNNLNKLSRKYVSGFESGIRRKGLKFAGVVFSSVLAFELFVNTIFIHKAVKDFGGDFKKEWMRYNKDQLVSCAVPALMLALLFYLLAELEIVGARELFKHYAASAVKRYAHDAHIDVSGIDEATLCDVADLLIACMNQDERARTVEIGVALDGELAKIDFQDDIMRNKVFARSKDDIAKVLDSVLARNPEIEALVMDILTGKTKYNKFMANMPHRSK